MALCTEDIACTVMNELIQKRQIDEPTSNLPRPASPPLRIRSGSRRDGVRTCPCFWRSLEWAKRGT